MRKKGQSLPFNTIVVAIIAIVVLVVLIFIYTSFLSRTTDDFNKPLSEADKKATDVSWCLSSMIEGQSCNVEAASTCPPGCSPATKEVKDRKCEFKCLGNQKNHKVAEKAEAFSCSSENQNQRYCCCE